MEETQHTKTIWAIGIVLLVIVAGYLLFTKYRTPSGGNPPTTESPKETIVKVENTPLVKGVLVAPRGFPEDIPVEENKITESATTQYPENGVQQLSLSYESQKTVYQKFIEYRDYMKRSGYTATEQNTSTNFKAIFGTKADANLSVVISTSGKTLIQLSYLLK